MVASVSSVGDIFPAPDLSKMPSVAEAKVLWLEYRRLGNSWPGSLCYLRVVRRYSPPLAPNGGQVDVSLIYSYIEFRRDEFGNIYFGDVLIEHGGSRSG